MAEKIFFRHSIIREVPKKMHLTIQKLMDKLSADEDELPRSSTTFTNWALGKMNWYHLKYFCNITCLPPKRILAPESQSDVWDLVPKEKWKKVNFYKRKFVDDVVNVFDRSKKRMIEENVVSKYKYDAFIHYDLSKFSVDEILNIVNKSGLYLFDYLIDNNVVTEIGNCMLAERIYPGNVDDGHFDPYENIVNKYEIMSYKNAKLKDECDKLKEERDALKVRFAELEKKYAQLEKKLSEKGKS